jgi:hypothetical protein
MMDAANQAPPVVIVQNARTHEPTLLFGFMAVGDEASMRKLEDAAKRAHLPAERTTNDKSQTEVMVIFPTGSDTRKALSLYRDAMAGAFGPLELEVTIAPLSAAADGKIDPDKEITVDSPNTIMLPQR